MHRLLVGMLLLGVAVGSARPEDKAKEADKTKTGLEVGDRLPELTSKNLEDKKVKLSDLRGKVVVVDVWATWCGPCKEMIPHERELVKKMKGKPFVVVSVSADAKKETLTTFLKKNEMPWTHWWDGDDGPVAKTLKIEGYPTFFVLDAKGVIRHKGLGWDEDAGKELDKVIDKLVKDLEAARKKS